MRLGTTLALTGAALMITGALAAPTAQAVPKTVAWAACPPEQNVPPGAECATLRLPVDWSKPDGATFGLSLARRKATGVRAGTLVFGPGGPGDSGVRMVVKNFARFGPEVRDRFDIVSFDPRGVGASNPVTCSADLLNAQPHPLMRTPEDFAATRAHNQRLRADCRAHTANGLYDHVSTTDMARDLDAVRAALGETRLNYHGSSYGTLLGQRYAELYPRRVRTMILESVVDHSVRSTRRFLEEQAASTQGSFDEFVKWCEADGSCALHGRDVRNAWRDLLARAERGEVPDPDAPGRPLDPFVLVNKHVFPRLYGPDHAAIAKSIADLERPAAGIRAAAEPPKLRADPLAAVFCSDWSLPVRDHRAYTRQLSRLRELAPDMPYPRPVAVAAACLGAPKPEVPQHRLRVKGTPKILLTNAAHDPATPHRWARSVERQLDGRGVLLTYAGAGHGSTNRNDCMRSAVLTYLLTGETPPPNTTCPAA